jgi:trans-2,3-dihydro-3-hydroxyanthranilate isomerase
MTRYRFVTLDVFTDQPFGGNPLAVFPEAEGIDDAQMQAIAREFNLSETVFILPGTGGADANLRIFTPAFEMPFAGHPTVGSCLILAGEGRIGATATLSVKAGMMAITVADGVATITAPQPARTVASPAPDADSVASALGLQAGDVEAGDRAPINCSAGANFLFACAASRDVLARAQPGSPDGDTVGTTLVALGDLSGGIAHMRTFAPGAGIAEDPATGSAAAALPAYLRHMGLEQSAFVIHQGDDMGRPSRITVTVITDDAGDHVSVGGSGHIMSEGEFIL